MINFKPSQFTIFILLVTVCLISFLVLSNTPLNVARSGTPSDASTFSYERISTNRFPGMFVEHVNPQPSNASFCNFQFGLPKALTYKTKDLGFGPELGKNGSHRILYNVVAARVDSNVPNITYATHITAEFVNYIPELLRYWDGFVSVAAFVPDIDVALVLEQINQYCYCLPEMSRVSIHLVFNKQTPPSTQDVYFNEPQNCKVADASKFQTYRSFDEKTTYPINVCRNAARNAAATQYVLVSDIQLIPNQGLAENFLRMVDVHKMESSRNRVFVLPIFEVESTEEVPRTKGELVKLISDNKAVYFHKLVCTHCQKFPRIEAWMLSDPGVEIKPFTTVRREVPYHRWEPIYIGTKHEPLYNEMLSWEGLQDKMLQSLEMCLIGYDFVILDGAFLVHWPGMKKTKDKSEGIWRNKFEVANSREYNKILKKLSQKYEAKPQCRIQ